MRLVDFNFSTADYDASRPIYLLIDQTPTPVTELNQDEDSKHLILVTDTGRPLTLDQFTTRIRKLPGSWRIVSMQPTTRELFGYRLVDEKIVFM